MFEKDILIETGEITIAATLCLPEERGRHPMMLLISGSGPLDRDENAKGMKLDVFNAIAHHLCARGTGSLRYDKRGCGASSGHYLSAGHDDFVNDAAHLSEFLLQQSFSEPKQVYVAGHSEGAIIAPQVAAKNTKIAGLVLLCPFVQALEQVLHHQARQMQRDIENLTGIKGTLFRLLIRVLGNPTATQRQLIERIKRANEPVIRFKLKKINAKWFRQMFALDPPSIYKAVRCPTLIVGGAKDLQCDPKDVAAISELIPALSESHVLPDLSHILRQEKDTPSLFNYRTQIRDGIDHRVLDLVASWIQRQTAENL